MPRTSVSTPVRRSGRKCEDISIVGLLGEVAESGGESGPQLLNRYAPLLIDYRSRSDCNFIELVPDNGGIWMKFTSSVYVDHPILTESGFARCVCMRGRSSSQTGLRSRRLSLRRFISLIRNQNTALNMTGFLACRFFFDSYMNAMLVNEKYLSISTATNAYLSQLVTRHADEMLRRLTHSKSIRGHVENVLIPILHTGEATIGQVAKE